MTTIAVLALLHKFLRHPKYIWEYFNTLFKISPGHICVFEISETLIVLMYKRHDFENFPFPQFLFKKTKDSRPNYRKICCDFFSKNDLDFNPKNAYIFHIFWVPRMSSLSEVIPIFHILNLDALGLHLWYPKLWDVSYMIWWHQAHLSNSYRKLRTFQKYCAVWVDILFETISLSDSIKWVSRSLRIKYVWCKVSQTISIRLRMVVPCPPHMTNLFKHILLWKPLKNT